MMHAGSLLSCWLGFAQVGLGANLTHGVTLTSFLLAPPLVTGFPWRDTNCSWWDFQTASVSKSSIAGKPLEEVVVWQPNV